MDWAREATPNHDSVTWVKGKEITPGIFQALTEHAIVFNWNDIGEVHYPIESPALDYVYPVDF